MTPSTAFATDFIDFIEASPSSYHAAAEVAHRLDGAGYVRREETEPWDASPGGHYVVRGGAVIAWWVPAEASPETSGFRIVGSHTDSPGFVLKPRGDLTSHGWNQAGVEVYGGPVLASWLDRELALAGRIVLADGTEQLVDTGPVLRIPHLAVHLDRSVNTSLTLDRQRHMQPVFAVGDPTVEILDVIADAATGVAPEDIVGHDLITVDTQRGRVFGARSDFIAAGRMDNLTSVFASLDALAAVGDDATDIAVLAAFDHEEVGSSTAEGACGPLLETVLHRTATALGADADGVHAMLARSTCVSADAAHSVHPNHPEKHDPVNAPVMNAGPVLKVNASRRYATDGRTTALWRQACREAGVPCQVFAGNNDVPCGSTIGPLTATRLGVPTVDVGVPLLSMHSAREMAGVDDLRWFRDALAAYWS